MEKVKKRISIARDKNLTIPYNGHAVFLGLIIFLNLSGFYLLTNFSISPTDIAVVLELGYVVYILFTRRNRAKYRYKWAMLMPVVLMVTSSIMANYSYSQPLWLGIRAQRTWVCAMLMYFPITKLMQRGEFNVKTILTMLDVANFIYIMLVIVQYVLGDSVQIMIVQSNERYSSIRLYVALSFVLISYFVHLLAMLQNNKITFLDVFFIVTTLFINFFVTKSRMAILCLLIGTALAILSIRFSIKKLVIILVAAICLGIFLVSEVGQDLLITLIDASESVNDTSEIRDIGREFFITQTLSDWKTALFGCGFPNIDWPQTVIGIRYDEGIYSNDNGIFGLLFNYGFVYVIWHVCLYIKLAINAWKTNKAIFFLLVTDFIKVYTLYPMSYLQSFSLVLICAILESEKNDLEYKRNQTLESVV